MRNINPIFDDEDFDEMTKIKNKAGLNWHDLVLHSIRAYAVLYIDKEEGQIND